MKQVIAAHGWAGDASVWSFWERSFTNRGWHWQSAERGYGGRAAVQPSWSEQSGERLLLCHSLGPHLLPTSTLEAADTIVLLGGFASFVSAGAAGRRQAIALRGMEARLGTAEEDGMLQKFLERCASPLPASALPAATLLSPLSDAGRQRLQQDLELLRNCNDLPVGWPRQARTLVIQGEEDAIVSRESQELLLERLQGQVSALIQLPGHGHALITAAVLKQVLTWLETGP